MAVTADDGKIREELRKLIAEVLYCTTAEVDGDTPFADLGVDSVLIVEFIAEINARYPVRESVESLYEHPTLNLLAEHLHRRTTAVSDSAGS
ncbi:acyl carrier protein [Amycolatopsis magusensis]|uniref:acyl carrier protein n=1 Tax=Amycolatopsis magusensis TaxID=882444 RepID=UPI003C2D39FF